MLKQMFTGRLDDFRAGPFSRGDRTALLNS
jgi:hypothetical protein